MKSSRSLSQIAAGALALALAYVFTAVNVQAAAQPGPEQGKAKVASVSGRSATYTEAGGAPMELRKGMILKAGTTIQTGPGTTVYLDLGENGRQLSVKPDSTLSLDKLTIDRTGADTVIDTQMEIKKGSIVGNVQKLSAASNYSVKTAKGVAGIRGTAFHIYAVGIFRCANGQIVVTISEIPQPGQVAPKPIVFTVAPGTQVDLSAAAPSAAVVIPMPQALVNQINADLRNLNAGVELVAAAIIVTTADPETLLQSVTSTVGSPTSGGLPAHPNIEE